MKIGATGSAQESYNGIQGAPGYGQNPSKNVRIVLVGGTNK